MRTLSCQSVVRPSASNIIDEGLPREKRHRRLLYSFPLADAGHLVAGAPQQSDLRLLGKSESIFCVHTEVPHRVLDLGMTK